MWPCTDLDASLDSHAILLPLQPSVLLSPTTPHSPGPLQALVTQVQVRNNVVIVHPLPARMQESNTLVLDFQPADHMLCHGAARPDVHRRSLELLRRCWEFKYGRGPVADDCAPECARRQSSKCQLEGSPAPRANAAHR